MYSLSTKDQSTKRESLKLLIKEHILDIIEKI